MFDKNVATQKTQGDMGNKTKKKRKKRKTSPPPKPEVDNVAETSSDDESLYAVDLKPPSPQSPDNSGFDESELEAALKESAQSYDKQQAIERANEKFGLLEESSHALALDDGSRPDAVAYEYSDDELTRSSPQSPDNSGFDKTELKAAPLVSAQSYGHALALDDGSRPDAVAFEDSDEEIDWRLFKALGPYQPKDKEEKFDNDESPDTSNDYAIALALKETSAFAEPRRNARKRKVPMPKNKGGPAVNNGNGRRNLINNGNTCYFNAVLQCLAHNWKFVDELIEIPDEAVYTTAATTSGRRRRQNACKTYVDVFKRVVTDLRNPDKSAAVEAGACLRSIRNLEAFFGDRDRRKLFVAGRQWEAGELLLYIVDFFQLCNSNVFRYGVQLYFEGDNRLDACIAKIHEKTQSLHRVARLFTGWDLETSSERVNAAPWSQIQLAIGEDVRKTTSLAVMLENHYGDTFFDDPDAANFGKFAKRNKLEVLPEILALRIKRDEFDALTYTNSVNKAIVTFPITTPLDVEPYMRTGADAERTTYLLQSVINWNGEYITHYDGSQEPSGHYTAWSRDVQEESSDPAWWFYDDQQKTPSGPYSTTAVIVPFKHLEETYPNPSLESPEASVLIYVRQ